MDANLEIKRHSASYRCPLRSKHPAGCYALYIVSRRRHQERQRPRGKATAASTTTSDCRMTSLSRRCLSSRTRFGRRNKEASRPRRGERERVGHRPERGRAVARWDAASRTKRALESPPRPAQSRRHQRLQGASAAVGQDGPAWRRHFKRRRDGKGAETGAEGDGGRPREHSPAHSIPRAEHQGGAFNKQAPGGAQRGAFFRSGLGV